MAKFFTSIQCIFFATVAFNLLIGDILHNMFAYLFTLFLYNFTKYYKISFLKLIWNRGKGAM